MCKNKNKLYVGGDSVFAIIGAGVIPIFNQMAMYY